MLSLIPFTVCAFLALITSKGGSATPSTISLQCSENDVCAALETLTRRQDRLQKTLNLCTDGENMITSPIVPCHEKLIFLSEVYLEQTFCLNSSWYVTFCIISLSSQSFCGKSLTNCNELKCFISAKSEGRRTIRFGMAHDTSSKQHNISSWKFRPQISILQRVRQNMMSYLTSNSLLDHAKWWVSISKYFI